MKTHKYITRGVCSRAITVTLADDGTIENVKFEGGCSGNTQGLSALVRGMKVEDAIERMKGIKCGFKTTSCPDQLAKALTQLQEQE